MARAWEIKNAAGKKFVIRSLIHDEEIEAGERDAPDTMLRAQIDAAQQRVRDTCGADGYASIEDWQAAMEKLRGPAYAPKLPRIRIVRGGLPGRGRRR